MKGLLKLKIDTFSMWTHDKNSYTCSSDLNIHVTRPIKTSSKLCVHTSRLKIFTTFKGRKKDQCQATKEILCWKLPSSECIQIQRNINEKEVENKLQWPIINIISIFIDHIMKEKAFFSFKILLIKSIINYPSLLNIVDICIYVYTWKGNQFSFIEALVIEGF